MKRINMWQNWAKRFTVLQCETAITEWYSTFADTGSRHHKERVISQGNCSTNWGLPSQLQANRSSLVSSLPLYYRSPKFGPHVSVLIRMVYSVVHYFNWRKVNRDINLKWFILHLHSSNGGKRKQLLYRWNSDRGDSCKMKPKYLTVNHEHMNKMW